MRNGPEIRITGHVTTVTGDTSVVITQDREDSNELNTQAAARTVTITEADTSGQTATGDRWVLNERIEVVVRALDGA